MAQNVPQGFIMSSESWEMVIVKSSPTLRNLPPGGKAPVRSGSLHLGLNQGRQTSGFRTISSQDIMVNKQALNTVYLKSVCMCVGGLVYIFGANKNVRTVEAL